VSLSVFLSLTVYVCVSECVCLSQYVCVSLIVISKICTYPNCYHTIQEGSRCDDHPHKPFKGAKRSTLYLTNRWRKVRDNVLRIEPLCRECAAKDRTRIAKVVDHILSMRDGGHPTHTANLQPLCYPCHNRKTGREVQARLPIT